jgi:hypothetical protein
MQNTENQVIANEFETLLNVVIQERKYAKIQYFTDLREFITVNSLIKSRFQESAEELIELTSGEYVKLTNLVSINGIYAPKYAYIQDFTCDC